MTILIFVGTLLGSMALRIPIAFALLASSVGLMYHLDYFDAQILAQNVINGANSFPLLAVPFFLLAGEIMNAGGLSHRMVNLALALIGHIRGGLGYVTILAGCFIAALSGSAVADAAALTAMLLPMMRRAGHDPSRAAGLIASTGIIAPILPPSIALILFGVATNVSISKLFMAGIAPGLMIGVALWATWWWLARREQLETPPRKSRQDVWRAFRESSWALMLPVIILVGLRMGVFTPTEAAVVAAAYALFVATVIYRELRWSQLYGILLVSARTTAVIMLLVASAMVAAWLVTVADLPSRIIGLLGPVMDNPTLLLLTIMLLILVISTCMDSAPTILILAPVLLPVVKSAGIDPVYFGILFVVNVSIGLITPPVGTVLSTVASVSKMKIDLVTRGALPFIFTLFAILLLFVLFPPLITIPAGWLY
ncbi:TRAP transporter large permease subunit [Kerstersia sp.]|uniref:TRAP transporter large permease subunit n=1 Tax=Kerstersia sp. TaxID=1930783 RepID=UPI003F92491D